LRPRSGRRMGCDVLLRRCVVRNGSQLDQPRPPLVELQHAPVHHVDLEGVVEPLFLQGRDDLARPQPLRHDQDVDVARVEVPALRHAPEQVDLGFGIKRRDDLREPRKVSIQLAEDLDPPPRLPNERIARRSTSPPQPPRATSRTRPLCRSWEHT
jgi:hypothetical protein